VARTRSLLQLRSDVCIRADIVDGGATGRHPSAELNRFINQAIQKYITLVSGSGGQNYYSKRTGVLNMGTSTTVDAAGWAPYQYIPLPSDFFELIGIDLIYGSNVQTLVQFSNAERKTVEILKRYFFLAQAHRDWWLDQFVEHGACF